MIHVDHTEDPEAEILRLEYRLKQLEVLERARWECVGFAAGVGCCRNEASQTHHVKRRSQGGGDTPENLLAVCPKFHEMIHARPAWARENGWLT